jgi:hypothetical protein
VSFFEDMSARRDALASMNLGVSMFDIAIRESGAGIDDAFNALFPGVASVVWRAHELESAISVNHGDILRAIEGAVAAEEWDKVDNLVESMNSAMEASGALAEFGLTEIGRTGGGAAADDAARGLGRVGAGTAVVGGAFGGYEAWRGFATDDDARMYGGFLDIAATGGAAFLSGGWTLAGAGAWYAVGGGEGVVGALSDTWDRMNDRSNWSLGYGVAVSSPESLGQCRR